MIDIIRLRIAFVALVALILSACASGRDQHTIGMQLSEAGKQLEAFNYLKQAVEKEPYNQGYQKDLAKVKEALIEQYATQVEQELSSSPVTIGAINNAKSLLVKASLVEAEHPKMKGFSGRIEKEENDLLTEIGELYTQARESIGERKWVDAYFSIQQIQSRFPNYEDTMQLMAKITGEGVEEMYSLAKESFARDDFKEASKYLQNVLSIKVDHQPSIELLRQVRLNDNKDYFAEKATAAIANKQWDKAYEYSKRVLEYEPGNKDFLETMIFARENSIKLKMDQSRRLMKDGWLLKAIQSWQAAGSYLENPGDSQLMELKKDLANQVISVAADFEKDGRYGAAWFWYKKLKEVDPGNTKVFDRNLAVIDKIDARIKKSVAVFDFGSPSNEPDAGVIFANNLSNYLFNNASGDIQIIERSKLKSIVEEMKLRQIGITEQSTKKMGDLYGIDVAIIGDVLKYKVETTVSPSSKSVRYEVGTKIEDNIEYLNWKAKHPKPSEQQLAQAPPAKVSVPEFANVKYDVTSYKKVGFIQLSFRIVDVATGKNIQVKTIERKITDEDDTNAGIEEANISYDPLEISTDIELLNKMTNEVVAEMGREVLKPLQNYEKIYFENGESFLKRRDELAAIESFVDAVLNEKLKMIQDSPLSKQAVHNMEEIFLNLNIREI